MECRFSALNSSPPSRQRPPPFSFSPLLPLEQPTSFQGAFPGSNVEGRSDRVQLNIYIFFFSPVVLFLFSGCNTLDFPPSYSSLAYLLLLDSKLCRCKASDPLGESERLFRRACREEKKTPTVTLRFFLPLSSFLDSSYCFLAHGYLEMSFERLACA